MRIAVTGSRSRLPTPDEVAAFEALWRELRGVVLLHGACPVSGPPTDEMREIRGVDKWAHEWAIRNGIPVEPFPPRQASIGWPRCGPERNRRMIATADYLIAFPGGRGTENCIRAAVGLRVPFRRVGRDDLRL